MDQQIQHVGNKLTSDNLQMLNQQSMLNDSNDSIYTIQGNQEKIKAIVVNKYKQNRHHIELGN